MNKDILFKLFEKDKELHLAYVGGIQLSDSIGCESFWKFYTKITRQKLHLHIYSKQPKNIVKKLKAIEKEDKYFHYEGFIEHDKLIRELTGYDFGIHLFGDDKGTETPIIMKVAFSNKNYDYLSANIPTIVSSNLLAASNFIRENGIGIVVEYSEINSLKSKLNKWNKSRLCDGFVSGVKQ